MSAERSAERRAARPLEHALELARRDIPVFPCHPGDDADDPDDPKRKKPLTKHGFKDASSDVRQVRRWWAQWPNALVGVPTGSASGLLVIDIDFPDGLDFVLGELGSLFDGARRHGTRRGGIHYLFRAPIGMRVPCSAGRLARRVDVRAEGGYFIWWPAAGLDAHGPEIASLPPVPARLLQLLTEGASRAAQPPSSTSSGAQEVAPEALRRLKNALAGRDADCGYEEWVLIGMALHHESGGSEEGFVIWDDWSKGATQKYRGADDLRAHWRSFSSAPGKRVVGAGTILRGDTAAAAEFPSEGADTNGRPFVAIPDCQFVERACLSWHIKGVLPRAELVVLYGPSGSGKSFLAFDIAAAISTGSQWYGRRVARGLVVYVVAEGATGFLNRLKAYAKMHAGSLPGMRIVADAPNFLREADSLLLATEIQASGGADLVVIDTLAACSPGADENAAKDMGSVIEHCKQLHKATGATVLLIHHSGKDESKGARGWSGLRAAVDAEIEVSRYAEHRTALVKKMKGGEDGAEFGFKLVVVEIGVDVDGDAVTSCVVEPLAAIPTATRKEPRVGTIERTLLDAIRDHPSVDGSIPISGALETAVPLLPPPSGRDTRRQHLMRALRALASKGWITVEGDVCRIL